MKYREQVCAGGIDPGFGECPKCGATDDDECRGVVAFKPKDDYSHLMFVKQVDGLPVQCVDIDSMTEAQFKKYCRDTGTEWFQRLGIMV